MYHDFNILAAGVAVASPQEGAQEEIPVQQPEGLERVMLAEDRIFVVLAVVLIIWIGLAILIGRTDRRLSKLENELRRTERSEI